MALLISVSVKVVVVHASFTIKPFKDVRNRPRSGAFLGGFKGIKTDINDVDPKVKKTLLMPVL